MQTSCLKNSVVAVALLLISGCATTSTPLITDSTHVRVNDPLNHQPNNFGVWLNSPEDVLYVGDWLTLSWQTQHKAYINLFYISSSGQTAQLVRNQAQQAQQTAVFPSPQSPAGLRLSSPAGTEQYVLIASKRPLPLIVKKPAIKQQIQTFDFSAEVLLKKIHAITSKLKPNDWASRLLQLPLHSSKR